MPIKNRVNLSAFTGSGSFVADGIPKVFNRSIFSCGFVDMVDGKSSQVGGRAHI